MASSSAAPMSSQEKARLAKEDRRKDNAGFQRTTFMGDWRDSDDMYVPEADEFEGPRTYWTLTKCYWHGECNAAAWKKCKRYSFESPWDCVEHMKVHGLVSGKHHKVQEEVDAAGDDMAANIEEWTEELHESEKDRAEYRAWCDKEVARQQQRKNKRETETPAEPEPKKPRSMGSLDVMRKDGKRHATPKALPQSKQKLPDLQLISQPRHVDEGIVRASFRNNDVMQLTFRQAQLLADSLRRAAEASNSNARLCENLVTQFRAESAVISTAGRILEEICRENSR